MVKRIEIIQAEKIFAESPSVDFDQLKVAILQVAMELSNNDKVMAARRLSIGIDALEQQLSAYKIYFR